MASINPEILNSAPQEGAFFGDGAPNGSQFFDTPMPAGVYPVRIPPTGPMFHDTPAPSGVRFVGEPPAGAFAPTPSPSPASQERGGGFAGDDLRPFAPAEAGYGGSGWGQSAGQGFAGPAGSPEVGGQGYAPAFGSQPHGSVGYSGQPHGSSLTPTPATAPPLGAAGSQSPLRLVADYDDSTDPSKAKSLLGDLKIGWDIAKRVGRGAVNDVPAIAGGLAAVPGVAGRLIGDTSKMVGNAVAGTVDEAITHNYRGSQGHAAAVEHDENDAANIIGTMFGAGPKGGLLVDLATAAGYASGGQPKMADAQLKKIGSNILTYTEDHPLQQTLNILAISGVARAAALGEAGRLTNLASKTADAAAAERLLAKASKIRQIVAQADRIAGGGKAGEAARGAIGKGVARAVGPVLDHPSVRGAIETAKPYVERGVQTAQRINRFGRPAGESAGAIARPISPVYEFIRKNPGATVAQVSARYGIKPSVAAKVIADVRGGAEGTLASPAAGKVAHGASSPVPESYMNKNLEVDMRGAPPGSRVNKKGYPRNSEWYWKQVYARHPELFSPENTARITATKPKPPIVDDQWIKGNPSHAAFKGNILQHHHINGEHMAVPVPFGVHYGWFRALHPYLYK